MRQWYPRDLLRRTNWLHRVDALRIHDIREMRLLWEATSMIQDHCHMFVIWANVIMSVINSSSNGVANHLHKVLETIMSILQMLLSEGYCYFLDYMKIAYFPDSNRYVTFPEIKNCYIDDLSDNVAREMTGLSRSQLRTLFIHLRIPDMLSYEFRYRFTGEECLLHYLLFNRIGETKLRMSTNYFGGDPRRFTYSIRIMTRHIYNTFYHKISGDSMRMWMPYVDSFRMAIWSKIGEKCTVEETAVTGDVSNNTTRYVYLTIPFDSFRVFGFIDDTGFRTTAPGISTRRTYGFNDDVQRSFYSAYFAGHGIKAQAVTLPNGMFGSIFIGAWRVSDAGLLNMSGLDGYLTTLLREFNMELSSIGNQLPALYGDGIFPQLVTIIARYQVASGSESRVNHILAAVRQSVEHLFCIHSNVLGLFSIPQRFKLLIHGVEATQMILNSFFLLNCYTCMNESPNNFDIRPPTLQEYIPLGEALKPAPLVSDNALGEVYNYYA